MIWNSFKNILHTYITWSCLRIWSKSRNRRRGRKGSFEWGKINWHLCLPGLAQLELGSCRVWCCIRILLVTLQLSNSKHDYFLCSRYIPWQPWWSHYEVISSYKIWTPSSLIAKLTKFFTISKFRLTRFTVNLCHDS